MSFVAVGSALGVGGSILAGSTLGAVGMGVSSAIGAGAAGRAANAQVQASQIAADEQKYQFDQIQNILAPFVSGGGSAMTKLLSLLGVPGSNMVSLPIPGGKTMQLPVPMTQAQTDQSQQASYDQIRNSPAYQSLISEGTNAMLQNGAATGGLRGGGVQEEMARFRPQVLASLIQQQMAGLGGMAQLGQASAAQTGAAGIQTGQGVANSILAGGQATAQGILGQAQAIGGGISGGLGGIGNSIQAYSMLKGLGYLGGNQLNGSTYQGGGTYTGSPPSFGSIDPNGLGGFNTNLGATYAPGNLNTGAIQYGGVDAAYPTFNLQ